MNPWIRPTRPLIIAHRGYSRVAPENTMPAYQRAVDAGADMIEADVNITRDGMLVMIHDYFLNRVADAAGNLFDYTYAELQDVDVGIKFDPSFAGTRIPPTEELLQLAKRAGIMMCFEIKGGEPARGRIIAEKLMQLFEKYDAFDWVFISSYFSEASARAKQIAPQLKVVREWLPDDAPLDLQQAMAQVKELESPLMMLDFSRLTEEAMPFFHAQDTGIWAWNPFRPEDIERVIRLGVDGILGDDPELAARLVRELAHGAQLEHDS